MKQKSDPGWVEFEESLEEAMNAVDRCVVPKQKQKKQKQKRIKVNSKVFEKVGIFFGTVFYLLVLGVFNIFKYTLKFLYEGISIMLKSVFS